MSQPIQIVILGGGFGGLYTALRLSQLPWTQQPEIVLVDQQDRFLFSPLLYELVTEEMQTWEIAPPFAEVLAGTGVRFIQSRVTAINPEAQQVALDNGSHLAYTKLVIAIGGKTPLDIVPGAADDALPFRSLTDAYRLNERLQALRKAEKIRIAVVGGGYSGVEIACKLADRLKDQGRIRLIERGADILATSPEFNREAAKQALQSRQVWLDLETEVESIESEAISLIYKGKVDKIPVDIVLWTVGTKVSHFVKELPLKHNERGLLVTTPLLQALDYPDIYALGDVADNKDASGQQVPATAQSAFQQSDYCAWNIWASLTNRPLLPFRYQHLGELMTLGTDTATLSGLGVNLDGSAAHLARRLLYLYRMPSLKHQLNVGFNWVTKPLVELLS
ncbi:MAG: NAD(P)/FAD-dependent oxidoreductase [Cyanophyceae cyanobacterium]